MSSDINHLFSDVSLGTSCIWRHSYLFEDIGEPLVETIVKRVGAPLRMACAIFVAPGASLSDRTFSKMDFPTTRLGSRPFCHLFFPTLNLGHHVVMALQVPRNIYQRLVVVIDDLKNAVGHETAKALLTSLTDVELLESYP